MSTTKCPSCGYDLTGVPDYGYAATCPECGACCTPLEAERIKWRRRRWLVPLIAMPSCIALSLGLSVLSLVVAQNDSVWVLVVLIVLSAGLVSGVASGRTWIGSESLGYDRGRTTLGVYLLAWLVGIMCGVITSATAAAIAIAWVVHALASAHFN